MSPFDIQEHEQFVVLETVKLKHPSFCRGKGGTDGGYTFRCIEKGISNRVSKMQVSRGTEPSSWG